MKNRAKTLDVHCMFNYVAPLEKRSIFGLIDHWIYDLSLTKETVIACADGKYLRM